MTYSHKVIKNIHSGTTVIQEVIKIVTNDIQDSR